jgi:DNA-binding beta-propeller fold protein YncE
MKRSLVLVAMLSCACATAPEDDRAARAGAAGPQLLVSANDGKAVLANGVMVVPAEVQPDTVTVFDIAATPPRLVGEVHAPASVVGPPESVAVAPDQSIALVTGAMEVDPANPTATIPDDVVTVIDLQATPPAVLATLQAGPQASGVSINAAGTMALVANRADGTVSVLAIDGKTVTPAGTVDLGAPASGPSHVAMTPDGRMALVTRNNDSLISILAIEGDQVRYTNHDIAVGLKPYGIEITPAGDLALVAHVGAGPTGSVDTIGVIDLSVNPPRAIDQVAAGPILEGIAIAPDGRHVAVTVMNGSNLPADSPFVNDFALLKVFSLTGTTLELVGSAQLGHWCQGVAWRADAGRILVQCMVERQIQMFDFDGQTLNPAGALEVNGGPAGMRTAR